MAQGSAYSPFARALASRLGFDPRVVAAWQQAEGGPADNPLNLGGAGNLGHYGDPVDATADFLTTGDKAGYYKQIVADRANPAAQIGAIKQSPFDSSHYANGVLDRTSAQYGITGGAPAAPVAQAMPPQPSGNSAVSAARQFIGTPYSWGGGGPAGPSKGFGRGANTVGFDCSSLVQYAFAKAGVKNVPRTTYDQFKAGTPVKKGQLRPGDAVFFTGSDPMNGLPGHVGLYIGNNKYIQAPHTGASVEISDMSGRTDFVGARRYANGTATADAAEHAVQKIGAPAKPQQAGPRPLPVAVQQALSVLRS